MQDILDETGSLFLNTCMLIELSGTGLLALVGLGTHEVSIVGIFSSLRSLRFRLWDEDKKKFVGFRGMVKLKVKAKW